MAQKRIDFKALRLRAGIDEEELASHLGINWRTVSGWDKGRHHPTQEAIDHVKSLIEQREAVDDGPGREYGDDDVAGDYGDDVGDVPGDAPVSAAKTAAAPGAPAAKPAAPARPPAKLPPVKPAAAPQVPPTPAPLPLSRRGPQPSLAGLAKTMPAIKRANQPTGKLAVDQLPKPLPDLGDAPSPLPPVKPAQPDEPAAPAAPPPEPKRRWHRSPVAEARPELATGDFTFIDVNHGIGGMRRAFEAINGSCVFAVDANENARDAYKANHEIRHVMETAVDTAAQSRIVPHDVMIVTFPESTAGKPKEQTGLAADHEDVSKLMRRFKPRAVIVEMMDQPDTAAHQVTGYRKTYAALNRSGYHVEGVRLETDRWLPLHKTRVYLVAFRGYPPDWDLSRIKVPRSGPALRTILHAEDGSEPVDGKYVIGDSGRVNDKYLLTDAMWEQYRKEADGDPVGLVGAAQQAKSFGTYYHKNARSLLIRRRGHGNPRRVTPRECARLLGYDTEGRPEFRIEVEDWLAYILFGDAVPVPVATCVAEYIKPYMLTVIKHCKG